jgi:electron transport complex protein RnfC
MNEVSQNSDLESFVKLNGMECTECGSCAFVCPAKIPLTQAFKEMRRAVAASRRKS